MKYNIKNFFLILIFVFIAFSCKEKKTVIVLKNLDPSFTTETEWLKESIINELPSFIIFNDDDTNTDIANIYIDFISFWDYESIQLNEEDNILISRTWFVPKEDSLAGRKNTTLELCIEEKENLIPLAELTPPDIALRVDSLSVNDNEYPLIRNIAIQINYSENKKSLKNRIKKTEELKEFLINIDKPLIQEKPEIMWIASAGDVMLGRNAGNILLNNGAKNLLGDTLEILSGADLTVINLEGPLSSRGTRANKTFTFRFEPPRPLAKALKEIGIDAVLFANNHTFDFGNTAFLDTLDYLEEVNIGVLGAGRNLESVLQPWRFSKNNANLWGIASFPKENSGYDGSNDIAGENKPGFLLARNTGDEKIKKLTERFEGDGLNIVFFHGGAEWSRAPDRATRELYSYMARAGADLIIGSHPHIVQGFEWIDNEKLIFWSLGNFIFSGMQDTGGGDEGLLIRLGYFGKQPVYIEPYAVTLNGPRAELAPDEKLKTFLDRSRALLR